MIVISTVILLTTQSCGTAALNPDLQRQWMLTSFENYPREFLVKNHAQLDLSSTKSPAGQYRAFMGCNQMFVNAAFKKNGTVKFSDMGSTMMYCENNMALEQDFAKALPEMTRYEVDGHHLTLSNENGKTMKFVAADWD